MEAANGTAPSWDVTARAIGEVSAAAAAGRREMVVVAAFEVTGGDVMPSSKRELRSLIKKGDATGFHVEHFPQVGWLPG